MSPTPVFVHIPPFSTFMNDLYGFIHSEPNFSYSPHHIKQSADWPKDVTYKPRFILIVPQSIALVVNEPKMDMEGTDVMMKLSNYLKRETGEAISIKGGVEEWLACGLDNG